jgi:hypothetical protein
MTHKINFNIIFQLYSLVSEGTSFHILSQQEFSTPKNASEVKVPSNKTKKKIIIIIILSTKSTFYISFVVVF